MLLERIGLGLDAVNLVTVRAGEGDFKRKPKQPSFKTRVWANQARVLRRIRKPVDWEP